MNKNTNTFYWSAIVRISLCVPFRCGFLFAFDSKMAVSLTFMRHSASKNSTTLKTAFGVVQGH